MSNLVAEQKECMQISSTVFQKIFYKYNSNQSFQE